MVHWTLMGGLLRLVERGKAWAGWGPAQCPPRCTECNSPPINGQRTDFISFDVALENPLDRRDRERCLRRVSKANFGVVSPWPFDPQSWPFHLDLLTLKADRFTLTFWPPKLTVSLWPFDPQSWPFHPHCLVDRLWQFAAKSVHSYSKYRVHKFVIGRTDGLTDRRTDGHVENIVPPASLYWRRHKHAVKQIG